MTKEKVKSVFKFYLEHLDSCCTAPPAQFPTSYTGLLSPHVNTTTEIAHLKFMCLEAQNFIDADRVEKAMRWLGFLQGVLWARGFFTLEQLKQHSMPG